MDSTFDSFKHIAAHRFVADYQNPLAVVHFKKLINICARIPFTLYHQLYLKDDIFSITKHIGMNNSAESSARTVMTLAI